MDATMNANRFALPAQSLGLIAEGLQRNARRRVPGITASQPPFTAPLAHSAQSDRTDGRSADDES